MGRCLSRAGDFGALTGNPVGAINALRPMSFFEPSGAELRTSNTNGKSSKEAPLDLALHHSCYLRVRTGVGEGLRP